MGISSFALSLKIAHIKCESLSSLLLLFTKERPWASRSCCSIKEQHEWFASDLSKSLSNTSDLLKNYIFCLILTVFHCFSPFYVQERQKVTEGFTLFHKQITLSPIKKQAIRSKNRWANCQPWFNSQKIGELRSAHGKDFVSKNHRERTN